MIRNALKTMLILAAALAAAACETVRPCAPNCPTDEQLLAESGAVRLTPGQVRTHVEEKTEGWVHGGAYYHADGSLQVIWLKARSRGSWEVDANGNLCYELPKWQRRCHFYMQKADEIYLLDEGRNIGVRPTYAGNRLNDLGRTLPTGPRAKVN
jgi:hypothetical protein